LILIYLEEIWVNSLLQLQREQTPYLVEVDVNESPALQLTDEEFKRNTNAKIGKVLYQPKILAEQQQIILLNQEKILGLLLQKESSLPQLESEDMRKMFPLKTVQDLDDLSSLIAEEGENEAIGI
ncbi:hypothetical protein JTE90_022420, partial [Oedothorax gibbosus]